MKKYCCRLDQEYIMAVVRNRSGIDSGEIDYSIPVAKFQKQDVGSLVDIHETLCVLCEKVRNRISELNEDRLNGK